MNFTEHLNPKKTLELYNLKEEFAYFKNLINSERLPKTIMLTGNKGSGKFTLINHLMTSFFDKNNYDEKNNKIVKQNSFFNMNLINIFSNIIYLEGSNFSNVKTEDIRKLKSRILQSSIINTKRFIILDDIEIFNLNSHNALLKMIEEPTANNYFILINNKSKKIIETIQSRCLEFKIILKEDKRKKIIESLIKYFRLEKILNYKDVNVSPGTFIKFNYILNTNKINIEDDFVKNLNKFFNLYKKEKNSFYVYIIQLYIDYYFKYLKMKKILSNENLIEKRSFIIKNVNEFFLYNLNQTTLLNAIKQSFCDE